MAMPKKSRRTIVVNGERFVWSASEKWHRSSTQAAIPLTASGNPVSWYFRRLRITVTVQPVDDDRIKLLATAEFPNTIMIDDYPEGGAIRPRHVAELIKIAQADDWPTHTRSNHRSNDLEEVILLDKYCGSYGASGS